MNDHTSTWISIRVVTQIPVTLDELCDPIPYPSKITVSCKMHTVFLSHPRRRATIKQTIDGENDELEGLGLGSTLRPHMGDRNLKILWRTCIGRAPNPIIRKHMYWENMEQATKTFIHIHSWEVKLLLVIYKEAFTRTCKYLQIQLTISGSRINMKNYKIAKSQIIIFLLMKKKNPKKTKKNVYTKAHLHDTLTET